MPIFECNADISADEFLSALSKQELNNLVQLLNSDYNIATKPNLDKMSYGEWQFETAINKLHGKYTSLTKEEEETIINIAKKF
jgi:hypothetical protein